MQRGHPRQGRFWHFDPYPGHDTEPGTLVRFARDHHFKLYDDGRLFDLRADSLEHRPLPAPSHAAVRRKLAAVLARAALAQPWRDSAIPV